MPPRAAARASRERRARPIKGHILLDEKTALRLRRLRWRRIGIAVSVIAMCAALTGAYLSPLFRVQKVEVTGATAVSAEQLQELAGLNGQSMLRADLTGAQERIAALPEMASVKVERRWPQTVRIQVAERQPWGYWQSGDQRYVIDAEGVVLAQDAALPDGVPVLRDLTPDVRLAPGDRVDADTVQLTRTLLERVPAELALNLAAAEYSPASGLTVTTDAGYRVVLGDSQDVDYKLAVWRQIDAQLGRGALSGHVLDLRFGDRPSVQ